MSEERRKVLEMLAEKKITAEEAEKLLDKLSAQPAAEAGTTQDAGSSSSSPQYLRIVVDKPGHEQMNVRIPLTFARSGSHLLAVLPTRVREKLSEQGIDLSETGPLDPKRWATLIENMPIDIQKGNGKKVRIFCE